GLPLRVLGQRQRRAGAGGFQRPGQPAQRPVGAPPLPQPVGRQQPAAQHKPRPGRGGQRGRGRRRGPVAPGGQHAGARGVAALLHQRVHILGYGGRPVHQGGAEPVQQRHLPAAVPQPQQRRGQGGGQQAGGQRPGQGGGAKTGGGGVFHGASSSMR